MKKGLLGIVAVAAFVMLSSAFAVNTYAARKEGNTRPGWGYGDKNHVHTGPPGQSVRP